MSNSKKLKLTMSVKNIKGVGEKYYSIFKARDIYTIYDLLMNFPLYYIDYSKLENEIIESNGVYEARIERINIGRNYKRRLSVLRFSSLICNNRVEIIFFNKAYLKDSVKKDDTVLIYGKIEKIKGKLTVVNPFISFSHNNSIIPVYKNIGGVKSGIVKKIINEALENLSDSEEPLSDIIVKKHNFIDIKASLFNIHRPSETTEIKSVEIYKNRFKYYEFLLFQLELQYIRKLLKNKKRIYKYRFDDGLSREINKRLKFKLTNSQTEVFEEIKQALSKPVGMAGLLQGDVGSGKTVISFLTILTAVHSGFQTAVLVPTEVLANQHFKIAVEFFDGYKVKLLTKNTENLDRIKIIEELEDGKIDVIIGTHSILNEKIRFKKLSTIIIDEQHKFGVSQRAALFYKSRGVDLLVMTATPIPRTMLLSSFKDLQVFKIKDKPVGRKSILTRIIPVVEREKFYLWLSNKIKKGEKAYVILPLIEDSEFFSELHSIESEKKFLKNIFLPNKTGIISGKTDKEMRDKILVRFKEGNLKVILATTVIEVGIDVEDATIIVIEDADRYGLAALHQLRGRVGRGKKQSYCYLIPSKNISEAGKKRLLTIEKEDDGFKIAEIDLKMRGGGLISGFNQSGTVNFKTGNLFNDYKLFNEARDDAVKLINSEIERTEYIVKQIEWIKKKSLFLNFS